MREASSFDRKDSVAVLCAVLAAAAIMTNALFLQRGPHPAPLLVNKTVAPVAAAPVADSKATVETKPLMETRPAILPRPRPAEMEAARPETPALAKSDALAPPRPPRIIPIPEAAAPRAPDPIGEIIAPPARRVAMVQRVLSEYGYGQIKPTGNFDRETQDAIEQFQRSKKLTVTRQITPELMRELATLAGRPLE